MKSPLKFKNTDFNSLETSAHLDVLSEKLSLPKNVLVRNFGPIFKLNKTIFRGFNFMLWLHRTTA